MIQALATRVDDAKPQSSKLTSSSQNREIWLKLPGFRL